MKEKGFLTLIALIIVLVIIGFLILIWLDYYKGAFKSLERGTGIESQGGVDEIRDIINEIPIIRSKQIEDKIKELEENTQ